MSATSQAVAQIKQMLRAGGTVERGKLRRLAQVHARACAGVMDKAQLCRQLLDDGKRDEAILLAKESPDLRDEFQHVMFDEVGPWQKLCEQHDLPVTHLGSADVIKQLIDELYVENSASPGLLKSHRRLALAHAPLRERLAVLRGLAEADPNSACWREDIAAYEKARLDELRSQARLAEKAGELETLNDIIAELTSPKWQDPSVARLAETVNAQAQPHRERFAAERFAVLAEQFRQAHAAMDESQTRAVQSQWEGVIADTGISPAQDLVDETAGAMTWLAELSQAREEELAFERACAALDEALDDESITEQSTLDNLAATVLHFEQGMGELLAARYNSRVVVLQRLAKRRFLLKLSAVAAVLILLAAASTVLMLNRSRQKAIARWENQIAASLDSGKLDEVATLLDTVKADPEIASAPEIQALQLKYYEKHQAEQQRAAEFARAIASFELKGAAGLTDVALDRAEELAKTIPEREQLADWREEYFKMVDQKRRARELAFEKKLDQLEQLFAALQGTDADEWVAVKVAADQCLALARQLLVVKNVSSILRERAEGIQRLALENLAEAEERQARQKALEKITALYAQPNQLKKALDQFAKNYPETALAVDFSRAAAMSGYWQAVAAWRELVTPWQGHMRVSSSQQAYARRTQIDSYRTRQKNYPQRAGIEQYRKYLQAATENLTDGNVKHMNDLHEIIDLPLFADTLMIRTKDGKVYYLLEHMVKKRTARGKQYKIEYIRDGFGDTATQTVNYRDIDKDTMLQPSPQNRYAEQVRSKMRQFKGLGWETLYLEFAVLLGRQEQMDPILSVTLLDVLLSYADYTSAFEIQGIAKVKEGLARLDLDVPWMDPTQNTANELRPRAARTLEDVKPIVSASLSQLQEKLQSMLTLLGAYQPVGILLNNDTTVKLPAGVVKTKVYLLWDDMDDGVILQQVGSTEQGRFKIDESVLGRYPQGSPLFIPAAGPVVPNAKVVPKEELKTGGKP